MNKLIWMLLPLSVIFLIGNRVENGACIKSFESFAYDGPSARNFDTTLPFPPWQIEATIPPHGLEGYYDYVHGLNTAITRSVDGHLEIWVTGVVYGEHLVGSQSLIMMYQPESQIWEFISTDVEDTGLHVKTLFADHNGEVWGRTTWERVYDYGDRENFPVLSRFNERTRRFEVAERVLEIPLEREITQSGTTYSVFDGTRILLDDQNIFWIFAQSDGLYRYDPISQTTEEHADLTDMGVTQAIMAPDGSIYFAIHSDRIYSSETFLRIIEDTLFQFVPETGEIIPADLPDEDWPIFSGMLFDHVGTLWLGSIGYREPDGSWHLAHPNPEAYYDMAGSGHFELFGPPFLMLESSNGILWYSRFADTGGWVDGTAWYDPETGEGCLFTNIAAIIVEDSQQQLWLVADGCLYRYALNQ